MENSKRITRELFNSICKGLKSCAIVLFLSVAGMFISCFVYFPDLAAQTDQRQIVGRERVSLRLAQSIPVTNNGILFAQSDINVEKLRGASEHFNSGSRRTSEAITIFLLLLLLCLLISGLIYYDAVYLKQQKNLENPWVVFKELCKAHQLRRREKLFLQRAADGLGLDDPLPLFIEPKFLMSLLENNDFKEDRMEVMKLLHMFFGIEPA